MEREKLDNLINRINELAKKSKTSGLSDTEKIEQQSLRKEYINAFRNNMKKTLDSVTVVDKNGNRKQLRQKNKDNLIN
ncbi:DUF896 domain-containing protein [Pseudobacteroides cellulosolvens]|uniref:UPF0291 protein Bccel_4949 n=1 Tax=Pseudobacteroides cellulosolvens ATCC 35603 = DSM 2933 TaxID=398512 RepID=A0A0L6JVL1_9FIRM|nr:DUF896 domain-containing protein [Pseudobacteroides cellulosolvens]KNY29675.1 UPF0291 protein [Pseudobacteroides cellulosolvens ATCC 35603 = DSM 2933]